MPMPMPSQDRARKIATTVFGSSKIRYVIGTTVLPLAVLVLYLLLGGWMFSVCEYQHGIRESMKLREAQETIKLARKALQLRVSRAIRDQERNESMWRLPATQQFKGLLDDYQDQMKRAVSLGFNGESMDGKTFKNVWSFERATMFSLTTISLIGYGRVAPRTGGGQIVVILYSLIGAPLMLLCLSKWASFFMAMLRSVYNSLFCVAWWKPRRKPPPRRSVGHLVPASRSEEEKYLEPVPVLLILLLTILLLAIGSLEMHLIETGWTLVEALYFVFITFSTIGLGDYVPTAAFHVDGKGTVWDALMFAVYMFMGLVMLTTVLGMFAQWVYGGGDDDEEDEEAGSEFESDNSSDYADLSDRE